jgi:hypothetical protein
MSFITKFGLEYMLRDKRSLDDIRDFCSKKSTLCSEHKNLICKKSLEVSGYTVPSDTNSCLVFKELLKLAQSIERPSKTNILLADTQLIDSVDMYGSDSLKEFFIKNGKSMRKRASKITKQIMETETLPNSNNFARTIMLKRN